MGGIVPWTGGGISTPSFTSPTPPVASQPSLRDWWRELHGNETPQPPSQLQSAVVGLRHNGESAALGAILALIDTDLGGLDLGGRIPLDWVGAAVFYALSIQSANKPEGLSADFRAMSQSCTTVAMYRMVHRWREARKGIPRNTIPQNTDPVMKAGRSAAF